jgi:hypothetical protein
MMRRLSASNECLNVERRFAFWFFGAKDLREV